MLILPCIPWAETTCLQRIPKETDPMKPNRGSHWAEVPNLGQACNEIMAALPDGAWACLMDHDMMFTTRQWYAQLHQAIQYDSTGTFVPYVYRGGAPWQRITTLLPDVTDEIHDIRYHRALGEKVAQMNAGKFLDVTDQPIQGSGTLILLSKEAWQETDGFRPGSFKTDHWMFHALQEVGRRIYLMHGVYVYHWKRAAGECHPALVHDHGR